MADEKDRGALIVERKKSSREWMKDNFYPEWVEAYQHYKVHCDPKKNDDGTEDPERSAIGSPLTHAAGRRLVSRVTAQIPNFSFHSKEKPVGDLIGRTLMYQWDRARIQRIQKLHVLQGVICGWSPRAWYWAVDEHPGFRRLDISQAVMSPEDLRLIAETYNINPRYLVPGDETTFKILTRLLEKHGRGQLLPVKYVYTSYEGPKCDFTFVGDCFPQPYFRSLQTSDWFIRNQRRDRRWIDEVIQQYTHLGEGFERVLRDKPNGMKSRFEGDDEDGQLFRDLLSTINKTEPEEYAASQEKTTGYWTVTEHHVPGPEPYLEYTVGNDYIGRIDYPYDLAGRIAYTDCVLIDDLLSGIGDSSSRVLRGLHKMHERTMNARLDLVYNLVRPLLGTRDRKLLQNPDSIKRGAGFRLVYMRGPGDLWMQPEQAALAAAATALQDESAIMRQFQLLTGEANMSMMANVDPNQNKTATGAKLMANQMDILTKDLQDAFMQSSLIEDAEMMWLLNRSELSGDVEFEASRYNRASSYQEDAWKERWVKIQPIHFQVDGEVVVEAGSTMADDDETNVAFADQMLAAALGNPGVFKMEKARDNYLIAHGKRHELDQWVPPPPGPPPPPEMKLSMNTSVKWEELSEEERVLFKQKAGLAPEQPPPPEGPPGMPPGGPPMPEGGVG